MNKAQPEPTSVKENGSSKHGTPFSKVSFQGQPMEKSKSEFEEAKAAVEEPYDPLTDPNTNLVKVLSWLKS